MSTECEFADLDELDELDGIDWGKADLQLFEPEFSVPNCNTNQYTDQNFTNPPTSSDTDVRLHSMEGFDVEKGETWQYPIDFPLRDYQFSIVRRCLFTNTLVCLPTGLGKTFIAAVVMLNFYRWYPDGKIVFMAPTKPLVNQQIQACCNITALPKYEVAELTGATSAQKRNILWKQNRVFFLTPQVMQNDLSSGICPAKQIVCCVIDEAHKALGNYAYTQVVKELVVNSVKFRVLALSATPGDDMSAIQEVINNLLISCIELRTEESIDVMPYTHRRKVDKYVLKLDGTLGEVNQKFLNVLGGIAKRLYSHKAVYTDDAKKLGRFQLIKARESFRNSVSGAFIGPVEGEFAVGISLYHSYELLYCSGIRACYLSIKRLLSDGRSASRLHSEVVKNPELNQVMCKMEKLVDSMHKFFLHANSVDPNVSIVSFGDDVTVDLTSSLATDSFFYSHPKLLKLEEVVVTHFRTASASDNTSTRVMIFSSYRDSVEEISVMLHRHTPLVRVMCFYGHGSRPCGAQVQKGFTQKEQLKVMERFRGGGYNVLVSTCVGEEGLDIGDVDLIVCFDSPKAPTRYVQRMGRTGRKREGRIVMLLSEGKEEQAYQKCQSSKKHIYKIVTEGRKHLNFYPDPPRMVPTQLSPQPNKLYLQQQQQEEEEENKPSIITRATRNVKKKHTKCTDKLPGFSTAMSELKNKDNPLFSKEDIAKSLAAYSLSEQETLQIQQRLSRYTEVREMLSLKDEEGLQGNSCESNTEGVDYCQMSMHTDLVSHSTKSQSMIDLFTTFDHLRNSENAVEEYEAALHINTTPQHSMQTGFKQLSLKTNINQISRGAKNKKKHLRIDSSDSESLLECSTTPPHNNDDRNYPVKPDSIEHPFASATVRQRIFTLESSSDEANSDDDKQQNSRNSSHSPPPFELGFSDYIQNTPDTNIRYNNTQSFEDIIHSSPRIFYEESVEIELFDTNTPKATTNRVSDSPTHTPISTTHLSSLVIPGISLLSKTSTPNRSSIIADTDIICIDTTDEKLRDCIQISPLLNPITSLSFIEDIPGPGVVSGKKKLNRKNTQFESSDSENEAFQSLCRKRKFQSKRRIISSQFSPVPSVTAPNNPRKKRRLNCFIDDEAIESDGEYSNNSFLSPAMNDTSSVYTEDNSAVSRLIADTSVNTTGCNESSVYARYVRDIISPPVAPVSKLVIDPKRHRILATAGKDIIKFKERKFDSVITDSSVDYEAEEVYGVIDEEAERLLFESPTANKSNIIFTPPQAVKLITSTNSVILIDSSVTDKQDISFSLGMDDWMEDPISVTSVEESKQPSLENGISNITTSPLKQTFSLGMDDWWEDIDPGDLDTNFLTNNPPPLAQGKSEILPSTPSLASQSTTTTTCTSTPVLSFLSKEPSLSVTHSPIPATTNTIVIDSFSSSFRSPYYSTAANQSSLMTSSLNNSESSIVIFADTREVSGSQILSSLRIKHSICIHVYSLKHCSYLVSSRMAVDRHSVSDLSQQSSTQKIIDRARSMCELYERCSVIVERDRVRSKLQAASNTVLARNQLFLTNLARLCKSRISVLFSGSEQNTIDILLSLSKQEAKRGHKITGSLLQVDTPLFKFICCIPKISPTIALSLSTSLQNLNQLYISTPVELKEICVCITKEQIDSIHRILTHRYKSYALIQ